MRVFETEIEREWDGTSIPVDRRARVWLEVGDTEVVFGVDAPFFADPPPRGRPGPLHGLWEHEVVELFVAADARRYVELELGPHGHWVSLVFDGVRRAVACPLPLRARATIRGARWTGELCLRRESFPSIRAVNACSIHGTSEARRYASAAALPGPEPDFHQPEHFIGLG